MYTLLENRYFGNSVRDWLIALGILAGTIIIVSVVGNIVIKRLKRIAKRTSSQYDDIAILAVEKFILPLLYVGGIYLALSYLSFKPKVNKVIQACMMLLYTYFILRIITAVIQSMITSFLSKQEDGEIKQKQARGFIIITKVLVWILGVVFVLDNMGFNVSAIVAGLGVGGIAIALAAQTVLGDLFSYFIIFFDRPFEIGDQIVFDKETGTVEYVGVKSTRIRTLNGQILVCSNKDLTNARVNNYKNMQRRRVVFNIGVVYQTPADKLERIPDMVKSIIEAQENVEFDRGHFASLGDSSLKFEFVYFVTTPDYKVHMNIQQEINYTLFRKFEEEGIQFAYPTQTLHIEQAKGATLP